MSKKKFFNTYGANPVSCAAARAVLRAIKTDATQENSLALGGRLLKKLKQLQKQRRFVGDVRGQGLMIGVELVKDAATKEPAPEIAARLAEAAKNNDVDMIAQVLGDACAKI
jgi:4-aminobutyrate aminotransferase-like enzyme